MSRTEGAYLIEKDSAIQFNYKDTDPELGEWQAEELVTHLEELLEPFENEFEVVRWTGTVEARPAKINKGTCTYKLLNHVKERKGALDFILSIGDDATDEKMFKMISALQKK